MEIHFVTSAKKQNTEKQKEKRLEHHPYDLWKSSVSQCRFYFYVARMKNTFARSIRLDVREDGQEISIHSFHCVAFKVTNWTATTFFRVNFGINRIGLTLTRLSKAEYKTEIIDMCSANTDYNVPNTIHAIQNMHMFLYTTNVDDDASNILCFRSFCLPCYIYAKMLRKKNREKRKVSGTICITRTCITKHKNILFGVEKTA